MPLCAHIAMTRQMAEHAETMQMVNCNTLNLPPWCKYIALKWSKEEAVKMFLAFSNLSLDDDTSNSSVDIIILSFTFGDEAAVRFLNEGELETDFKHYGYKFWSEIPLNGTISFQWSQAVVRI